jgi:hypothetical protein
LVVALLSQLPKPWIRMQALRLKTAIIASLLLRNHGSKKRHGMASLTSHAMP